jgi:hypothetical protein
MRKSISENFRSSDDTRFVRSTIERNRKLMATDEDWRRTGAQVVRAARRYEDLLRSQGLWISMTLSLSLFG